MKLLSHYIEHMMKRSHETANWKDHSVCDKVLYSYRDTVYDRSTYPSDLHYHDYYELVFFEEGNIKYLSEGCVFYPQYGDIILIPPGKFHMSVIDSESTQYKRHVFYLYPSAFEIIGHSELTSFLEKNKNSDILTFGSLEAKQSLIELLEKLKKLCIREPLPFDDVLMLSYSLQVFCLLNQKNFQPKNEIASLPENILILQRYIDDNFARISSVSEVAEHFYYSREYLSRLFKKYFDTSISDYIMKRRIAESQLLIAQDIPLIDIAYQVGFGSLSTFIRAFRTVTNMTPSEYRKNRKHV